MVTKEALTGLLKERPLSMREIVFRLKAPKSVLRSLRKLLQQMIKDGDVILTRRGLYGPAQNLGLLAGHFEAHKGGYGFFVPEMPATADLFIPPGATGGAMSGDRVIARLEDPARREGRVVRTLERMHTKVAGKVEITKRGCFLRPKNKKIPYDIYIAPKDRGGVKNGETAVAEIIVYPTDQRPPTGRVVKVLKRPEDPVSEIDLIIEEYVLPRRFPKEAVSEAKEKYAPNSVGGRAPNIEEERKDLRHLTTFTIDGERAKDFDDAVSIKLAGHGYVLYVHIADVGFYVGWGSPLDIEARKRGTSVYLPDRVIPMLPHELSEDLCSLLPKVPRPTFTVEMHFDRAGERTACRFYPSLIESDARLTYTAVKKIVVDRDMEEMRKHEGVLRDLELMTELTDTLRQRRQRRGSLDFDLPEPEVLLDLRGMPEAIIRAERNFAHVMIEEFMISANEAVAEHIEGLGVPSLYRIHEPPEPAKLEEMWRLLRPLVKEKAAVLSPKMLPEILNAAKGTPGEEVVNHIVLRRLKRAKYSAVNVGHFGLASGSYTHFTSPIRRYPDLVVHRLLRETLTRRRLPGERLEELQALLPQIASSSSRMEHVADDAEGEAVEAMRMWFMKDKVGEEFEGRVAGVTSYGLKIRLKDFYVEGFLHVSDMTDDFYHYDDLSLTLKGKNTGRTFRIGQAQTVRIDKVDMEEREITFGVAGGVAGGKKRDGVGKGPRPSPKTFSRKNSSGRRRRRGP